MDSKLKVYLEEWGFKYDGNTWEYWYARDPTGQCVASCKTEEELKEKCKELGYIPERRW